MSDSTLYNPQEQELIKLWEGMFGNAVRVEAVGQPYTVTYRDFMQRVGTHIRSKHG